MSTRTLAVVSAGLSTPSSTRLLADRLTATTVAALHERGITATVEIVELREHARDLADNLLTGFANTPLRSASSRVDDGLLSPALTTARVRVVIGPPPPPGCGSPRRARRGWGRRARAPA